MLLCDDDEVAGSLFAAGRRRKFPAFLSCLPSKVGKDSELREMRRTDEP